MGRGIYLVGSAFGNLGGFMGAFTTFSALILESGELFRSAEWLRTAAHFTMQNGLGFLALFVGPSLRCLA